MHIFRSPSIQRRQHLVLFGLMIGGSSAVSCIVCEKAEGCRWRALPEVYGPYTTVFNRYNRWSQRGLWQAIFAALVGSGAEGSSKKGEQGHAIGRSRAVRR